MYRMCSLKIRVAHQGGRGPKNGREGWRPWRRRRGRVVILCGAVAFFYGAIMGIGQKQEVCHGNRMIGPNSRSFPRWRWRGCTLPYASGCSRLIPTIRWLFFSSPWNAHTELVALIVSFSSYFLPASHRALRRIPRRMKLLPRCVAYSPPVAPFHLHIRT
jgi:hypothetical protein